MWLETQVIMSKYDTHAAVLNVEHLVSFQEGATEVGLTVAYDVCGNEYLLSPTATAQLKKIISLPVPPPDKRESWRIRLPRRFRHWLWRQGWRTSPLQKTG